MVCVPMITIVFVILIMEMLIAQFTILQFVQIIALVMVHAINIALVIVRKDIGDMIAQLLV